MPAPRRSGRSSRLLPTITALSFLIGSLAPAAASQSPVGPNDDESGYRRLLAMPRERRLLLEESLKTFDTLDRSEQEALRDLDRQVNSLPPADRDAAYATLRRYHLWVGSLTEAQRRELAALPTNRRMAFASRVWAEQSRVEAPLSPGLALVAFGGHSAYDLANQIKTWLALSPRQQADVARLNEPERTRSLTELRRSLGIPPVPRPPRAVAQDEALVERMKKSRGPFNPGFLKRLEDPSPQVQEKAKRRLRGLADNEVLLGRPLARPQAARLLQFDEALPPWLRALFDARAPGEAARELSVLYRLVFPAPQEFNAAKPGAPTTGAKPAPGAGGPAAKPATKPAPAKPSGDAPF